MCMTLSLNKWDIWLAKVAFEDAPNITKNRPVLVMDDMKCLVLSFKITSHSPRTNFKDKYQIIEWKKAGLLKPSTLRISKKLLLPKECFVFQLGRLQSIDKKNVINILSSYSKL